MTDEISTEQEESTEQDLSIAEQIDALAEGDTEGSEETADVDDSQQVETEQVDEYTPNLTYKVKDEERTFDERVSQFIKDKETEEYMRELYTKADGLDLYKSKLSEKEQVLNEVSGKSDAYYKALAEMREYRDTGDYRKLFKSIGVNEEVILEQAKAIIEEMEMPEEQRAVLEANRAYEEKLRAMESKLSDYDTKFKSFEQMESERTVANDLSELKSLISTEGSDVNSFLQEKGIDMIQEVINAGTGITATTGKEPSVREVFDKVVNKYKSLIPTKEEVVNEIVNNRQQTLPKVKPSGNAAIEPAVRSFEDLRQLAAKM